MSTINNRQQRINRENRKRQAGGLIIILVAIFLLIGVGNHVFRLVKGGITHSALDYQPAVNAEVEQGVTVKGVIIRPEKVITAPVAGRFENVVLNEERVRRGTVLGHLYPTNGGAPQTIAAPQTGMAVLGVDGLEAALTGFNFMSSSPQIFSYQPNFRLSTGEEIAAGQPFLKIVDNLAPLQVVIKFKLSAFVEPWESGKKIVLSCKGKRFRAEVTALKGSGGEGMALLTIPADDQIGRLRSAVLTVVENRAEGVTVSAKALVKQENGTAVYILNNGEPEMIPVTIICRNKVQAVVEGIKTGDLVLTNPEHISGAIPLDAR